MIKSMTGFGAHCVETEQARVLVEAKSVNGRFLKLSWKGPGVLNRYEHELEPLAPPRPLTRRCRLPCREGTSAAWLPRTQQQNV